MDLAARETCACANYLYTHTSTQRTARSTQQIPTQINLSGIGGGGTGSWRQINFSLFHPQSAAADAARTTSRAHAKISSTRSMIPVGQILCKNKLIQIVFFFYPK
jgi:hypothetical protein